MIVEMAECTLYTWSGGGHSCSVRGALLPHRPRITAKVLESLVFDATTTTTRIIIKYIVHKLPQSLMETRILKKTPVPTIQRSEATCSNMLELQHDDEIAHS